MQDSTRRLIMHQLGQSSNLEPFCHKKFYLSGKLIAFFLLIIWIKYIYNVLIWLRDCKTIITCIIKIDIVRCLWIKYIKKSLFNVGVWEARFSTKVQWLAKLSFNYICSCKGTNIWDYVTFHSLLFTLFNIYSKSFRIIHRVITLKK